jgi:hypothetical protein
MYKIEKKSYGFKITFSDIIDAKEMQKWVDESKKALFGNKEILELWLICVI